MKVRIETLSWIRMADQMPEERQIVLVAGGAVKATTVAQLPGPVPGYWAGDDKPRWYTAYKSTSGYMGHAAIHKPTHWAAYPKGPSDR